MLPVSNVTAKVLSRSQTHAKDERNRNSAQRSQTDGAHRLSLAVRVEQPVSHMEMGIRLLLGVPLLVLDLPFDRLEIVA